MNLEVLIPSLLLPAPLHKLISPPKAPALERLLARANRQYETAPSADAWLCARWGMKAPYPIAPLFAKQDGLDLANEGWMFAEPVHLVADRDRVKLYPARLLELKIDESAALIDKLNAHFADRGLRFYAPTADRWYVCCAPAEIPITTPANAVQTGSLADFQPESQGLLNWRSLQNEAQMLLFDHPVNTARDASGKPVVSGVWFWGGGELPALTKPAYDRVAADPGLAAALAEQSGVDSLSLPLSWPALQSLRGTVLVVMDTCAAAAADGDLPAWESEVARLDREWFQPIAQGISQGPIRELVIHVPDGARTSSFRLTRRNHLLTFWRSTKPLSTYA